MKLTLQEKIERGLVLNIGELAEATGYSRSALRNMGIRKRMLPGGKMRLSDFWERVKALAPEPSPATTVVASPVQSSNPPVSPEISSLVAALRAGKGVPRRRSAVEKAT